MAFESFGKRLQQLRAIVKFSRRPQSTSGWSPASPLRASLHEFNDSVAQNVRKPLHRPVRVCSLRTAGPAKPELPGRCRPHQTETSWRPDQASALPTVISGGDY